MVDSEATPQGKIPEHRRSFSRHASGSRPVQTAQCRIGEQLPDDVAHGHGRRFAGIHDRTFRGQDGKRLEGSGIVGDIGRNDALQTEHRVGLGIGQGAVDAVSGGRRTAGEVDCEATIGNGEPGGDPDLELVAVNHHLVRPGSGGPGAKTLPGCLARRVDDVVRKARERREGKLAHHVAKSFLTHFAAGDEGVEITLVLHRNPAVCPEEGHQRAVDCASLDELHGRDEHAFLVDVRGVGTEAPAADVGEVRGAGIEANHPAIEETRFDQHKVIEVAGPDPGIVGYPEVAGKGFARGKVADQVTDRGRHGVDVARRARHCLGHHAPLEIEDAR